MPDAFESARARFAAARKAAGLSQERLAELADVTTATVTWWECGRRSVVVGDDRRAPDDMPKLKRLCLALGVEPAAILEGLL